MGERLNWFYRRYVLLCDRWGQNCFHWCDCICEIFELVGSRVWSYKMAKTPEPVNGGVKEAEGMQGEGLLNSMRE